MVPPAFAEITPDGLDMNPRNVKVITRWKFVIDQMSNDFLCFVKLTNRCKYQREGRDHHPSSLRKKDPSSPDDNNVSEDWLNGKLLSIYTIFGEIQPTGMVAVHCMIILGLNSFMLANVRFTPIGKSIFSTRAARMRIAQVAIWAAMFTVAIRKLITVAPNIVHAGRLEKPRRLGMQVRLYAWYRSVYEHECRGRDREE